MDNSMFNLVIIIYSKILFEKKKKLFIKVNYVSWNSMQ